MKRYFIKTKDLVVNENCYQHDFLCEMHPVLDELYCKLWFYKNIAILNNEIKEKKILELEEYIKMLLKAYGIPENIMFIKLGNRYIEPFSRIEFNINKKVPIEQVDEEISEQYMEENKNNKFLKYEMSHFKELTKTKCRR